MENNILKSELVYPTKYSKKKKRLNTFVCSQCGKVTTRWYQKKRWKPLCNSCAHNATTAKDFVEKANKVHNGKYKYKTDDINFYNGYITVICKTHGEFLQRKSDHLQGTGCRKCADTIRGENCRVSIDTWKERLAQKFPHITLISTETGYHNTVKFVCNKHSSFNNTLGQITHSKYLCPVCYKEGVCQEQSIRNNLVGKQAILYYIYIPSIDMYKLGVTTQKLTKRFVAVSFNTVWTYTLEYTKAIALEHKLHTKFIKSSYRGTKKLLKTGNTELYKHNILPNKEILLKD